MIYFMGAFEIIAIPKTTEFTVFYETTFNQIGNDGFVGNIHIETDKKTYIFYDVENVCSRCGQIVQQIFEQKDRRNIVIDLKNPDDACFTLYDNKFTIEKN